MNGVNVQIRSQTAMQDPTNSLLGLNKQLFTVLSTEQEKVDFTVCKCQLDIVGKPTLHTRRCFDLYLSLI
jgi:hypothetical protein